MTKMYSLFATCPKGLEGLLHDELIALGAVSAKQTIAGVSFEGTLQDAYRACLWSRLANKVLLTLIHGPAPDGDALYKLASQIAWEDQLAPTDTLCVDFSGSSKTINNTQFGALKVKDAVVDRIRAKHGTRPSIDKDNPSYRLNARLHKDQLTLALDLAGESLHRRGYRTRQGAAPLKENLAAALLLRAGWPAIGKNGGALLDPMCGSGTILLEGALMSADIAPGLYRAKFGFETWLHHQSDIWLQLREEAIARRRAGLAAGLPEIRGYDQDHRVLQAAEANIHKAGLTGHVRVMHKPLETFTKPTHKPIEHGLILTNPPYGERLGEQEALRPLYQQLNDICVRDFMGWKLGVFTGNEALGREIRIRPEKRYKLFNGKIPSLLLMFDLQPDNLFRDKRPETPAVPADSPWAQAKQKPVVELSDGAQMLLNRLKKNQKQLQKWINREGIEAYRLYDADMPEYAVAVDVYGQEVLLQEYQAPKSIDEKAANQRFQDALAAVAEYFNTAPHAIAIKRRQRNRGKQQYEKLGQSGRALSAVKEGQATLLVNLWDYLDTGLFLDHRPVRLKIAEWARGKKFLNLFCYTATATVHAALGGASQSVSVDMSKTYLDWGRQNFEKNNINLDRHKLVQADCEKWLQQCREPFDLIMLDPPSFSNSKRMEGVLDIQRDHPAYVNRCMDLLSPGGKLIFSNNLRTFKLDETLTAKYHVEDITAQTLDPDFQRNKKIHHCWVITHKPR